MRLTSIMGAVAVAVSATAVAADELSLADFQPPQHFIVDEVYGPFAEAVAAASADPTQTTTVTLPCFVCFAVGTVAVAAVEALIVSAVASALLAAVSALTAATEGAAAPLEAALIAFLTNSFTVDAIATIIGVTAPLIATEACRGFFHCFT